jgi:hypothetical protein
MTALNKFQNNNLDFNCASNSYANENQYNFIES